MKLLFRLLIILIVSTLNREIVSAQHSNSFAGIRFGYALPLGQFASHDFDTQSGGGYALLGKSFGAEAAWFISPKLGFGFDISTNSFGFASGYYADDFIKNIPIYTSLDLLSGPYKLTTYMAGVYYKFSLTKKFSSTVKVMGGMLRARTPDQFFGGIEDGVRVTFWKTGSTNSQPSCLAGVSLEYRLYQQVSLLMQADLAYARMAFPFINAGERYNRVMQIPVFRLQPGINVHF
ncbi:MAG: hypothetical protein WCR72_14740 [Bacteroidota bacterium]